jgi:hypothetical protein
VLATASFKLSSLLRAHREISGGVDGLSSLQEALREVNDELVR